MIELWYGIISFTFVAFIIFISWMIYRHLTWRQPLLGKIKLEHIDLNDIHHGNAKVLDKITEHWTRYKKEHPKFVAEN